MPKYSYKCKSCDNEFDIYQSIKDDSLTKCDKCGGDIYRKIGKNVNVHYNASGFYCTSA